MKFKKIISDLTVPVLFGWLVVASSSYKIKNNCIYLDFHDNFIKLLSIKPLLSSVF